MDGVTLDRDDSRMLSKKVPSIHVRSLRASGVRAAIIEADQSHSHRLDAAEESHVTAESGLSLTVLRLRRIGMTSCPTNLRYSAAETESFECDGVLR
jgi:hypothetical protein